MQKMPTPVAFGAGEASRASYARLFLAGLPLRCRRAAREKCSGQGLPVMGGEKQRQSGGRAPPFPFTPQPVARYQKSHKRAAFGVLLPAAATLNGRRRQKPSC